MAVDTEHQNEYDESSLPGPGAPTPITALEVRCQSFLGATGTGMTDAERGRRALPGSRHEISS